MRNAATSGRARATNGPKDPSNKQNTYSKNTMNRMTKSSTARIKTSATCIVLMLSGFTASAQASSLLVDWSGKYLQGGTSAKEFLKGATTTIPNGSTWKYSDTAKNPTSDYDAGGSSAVFYGAFQATAVGTSTMTSTFHRIRAVGDHDEFWISTSNTTDSASTFRVEGLIFWKQEGFLNSAESLNASEISTISSSISTFSGTGEVRFAIRSGGQWYLSQVAAQGADPSFSLHGVSATNWATWSITPDSAPLPEAPTEFSIDGGSFTTVDAIGIYYNVQRGGGSSRRPEFGFANFEVKAIPEASGTALTLIGGLFAFGMLRPFLKKAL